ncbi:unnamed protein product, partial [Symbiodinium pilosum]
CSSLAKEVESLQAARQTAEDSQQGEVARLAAERESSAQQIQQLQLQLEEALRSGGQSAEQHERLQASLEEEGRQKEEHRQLAASFQEQCASLTKQLSDLQAAHEASLAAQVPNGAADAAQEALSQQ